MTVKRDLDYYLNNPNEIPEGVSVETLLGEVDDEGGSTDQTGEQSAASGAAGGEAAKKGDGQAEWLGQTSLDDKTTGAKAPEPVIKSKNGDHTIPYSVLESERTRRQAAERALAEVAAKEQALTAASANPASNLGTTADEVGDLVETVEQVAGDFPEQGKVLKALLSRLQDLQGQLEEVRQSEASRTNREADRASMTVQEAIDANPVLSFFQNESPDMFKSAIQFDNVLKADSRNQALSLSERFDKVVKAIEAVHGPTELPEKYRPVSTRTEPTAKTAEAKPTPGKSKAQMREEEPPMVRSLSDIPGGIPPESDEVTQLGQLSAQDLGNKFMKMSESDVKSILSRLG